MKKIILIVVGLGIVGLVAFKLLSNKKTTESKVYQFDKEKPISVTAETIQIQKIESQLSYTGTFEPNKESKISADIQGNIERILVDVGSRVSKGQTLVLIDNSLLKLQLQTVNVQIEGLENDVRRFRILTEADAIQGVQLEKAELGLKSAKVQRASLLEQISKTSVKAPFSGIVTAKLNEEGGFAAPGVPLIQITDISSLRFTVNVPESSLKQFKTDQNYEIISDAYPDIPLSGKIFMIASKANMGNSFPVQFQLNNTKELLIKSGMFGKVNFSNDRSEQGIIIPSSATIEDGGKTKVYLIKNGKAVLQTISVTKTVQDKMVVGSGLNPGDLIVTSGFINLFDGANVVRVED